MTAEAIQALRDKYNKEAPRVTEEQKQAHEQRVKDFGVDAFDQPGHNLPKAYHTNTADVVNELEQAMGVDWPKVKESIDNGKLKIAGYRDWETKICVLGCWPILIFVRVVGFQKTVQRP